MQKVSCPKSLAVFPLPVFLLPKGRTRLRIFEPRYVRMVKESIGDKGFVLTPLDKNAEYSASSWGAWVKIIDFETLPDGMLGITIEAETLVTLSDFYYEQDKLLNAHFQLQPHWHGIEQGMIDSESLDDIKHNYRALLQQQKALADLYPDQRIEELVWLIARWLEILPLDNKMREKLTHANSFTLAFNTVETIVLGK
jgi:Lon protease-like protein